MLSVNMPGSAAIVLSEAAKILRLDFIELDRVFEHYFDVGNARKELNTLMGQNGYGATSIVLNLTPIIALNVLILLATIIVSCSNMSVITDPNRLSKPIINGHSEPRTLSPS